MQYTYSLQSNNITTMADELDNSGVGSETGDNSKIQHSMRHLNTTLQLGSKQRDQEKTKKKIQKGAPPPRRISQSSIGLRDRLALSSVHREAMAKSHITNFGTLGFCGLHWQDHCQF